MFELTATMRSALLALATGAHEKSCLLNDWDARTIRALESHGLISVREYDGYLTVTPDGEKIAHNI